MFNFVLIIEFRRYNWFLVNISSDMPRSRGAFHQTYLTCLRISEAVSNAGYNSLRAIVRYSLADWREVRMEKNDDSAASDDVSMTLR